MTVRQMRSIIRHLIDLRRWDEDEIVTWCNWRMERNRVAKACDEQRRRAERVVRSRKRKKAL
jgi:hypothetical protein